MEKAERRWKSEIKKIKKKWRCISEPCVSLLFPRRCPVCGEIVQPIGEKICPSCVRLLSPVRQPCCKKCGKEISDMQGEFCPDCMRRRKTFDSGMALLNYNETARRSMAAIKYKNRREYLDFYAQAMALRFEKIVKVWSADALIPVPVHPSRRRVRGFNQAEELARRLSDYWEIPTDTKILIRKKKTLPQRDLGPSQRLKNLQEAFDLHPSVQDRQNLPKCVIIIDDIYTTGSTVEACSRILRAAGIKHIHVLAICIGKGR